MVPVEEALVGSLLMKLLVKKAVGRGIIKILDISAKRAGLRVSDPTVTSYKCHKTSLGCSKRLV